jgi:hypothetical protein
MQHALSPIRIPFCLMLLHPTLHLMKQLFLPTHLVTVLLQHLLFFSECLSLARNLVFHCTQGHPPAKITLLFALLLFEPLDAVLLYIG